MSKKPLATPFRSGLESLAYTTPRTPSVMVAEAVDQYDMHETDTLDSLHRALADERAGRLTAHDHVMREADAILAEGTGQDL